MAHKSVKKLPPGKQKQLNKRLLPAVRKAFRDTGRWIKRAKCWATDRTAALKIVSTEFGARLLQELGVPANQRQDMTVANVPLEVKCFATGGKPYGRTTVQIRKWWLIVEYDRQAVGLVRAGLVYVERKDLGKVNRDGKAPLKAKAIKHVHWFLPSRPAKRPGAP